MGILPVEEAREFGHITKKEFHTNPKYGQDPSEKSVADLLNNSVVLINKPQGPTSHQISDYVKKIMGVKLAGHSGTLDPNVTGLLPVCIGKATKIIQTLLPSGKEYVCYMKLHKPVTQEQLDATIKKFTGVIEQLPPIKSAVKRQLRKRHIYYIEQLEFEDGIDVLFRVGCEAGTYIRKLCDDMGKDLGCGAHMQQLVRSKVAHFKDADMVTLQDLTDALHYYKEGDATKLESMLIPIEKAVKHLPKIVVNDTAIYYLTHGAKLQGLNVASFDSDIDKGSLVAIFSLKGELVALGKSLFPSNQLGMAQKAIVCDTERVIMPDTVYPKV